MSDRLEEIRKRLEAECQYCPLGPIGVTQACNKCGRGTDEHYLLAQLKERDAMIRSLIVEAEADEKEAEMLHEKIDQREALLERLSQSMHRHHFLAAPTDAEVAESVRGIVNDYRKLKEGRCLSR